VLSGTKSSCYQGPKQGVSPCCIVHIRALNFSNIRILRILSNGSFFFFDWGKRTKRTFANSTIAALVDAKVRGSAWESRKRADQTRERGFGTIELARENLCRNARKILRGGARIVFGSPTKGGRQCRSARIKTGLAAKPRQNATAYDCSFACAPIKCSFARRAFAKRASVGAMTPHHGGAA